MISDRMRQLVEKFDNAAGRYYYEGIEGWEESRRAAEADYEATLAALLDAIEELEIVK